MSKQGQATEDLRNRQAADEAVADFKNEELEEKSPPTLPSSGVQRSREEVEKTISGEEKLPSFEEAIDEIMAIEYGDHDALNRLVNVKGGLHLCSNAVKYVTRYPHGLDGDNEPGWCCAGRKDGPLTEEQSKALADAINSKIDRERMKKDAEVARSRRDRKKSRKETVTDKTGTDPEVDKLNQAITEVLELVSDVQNLTNLNRIVDHCGRHKLVKIEYQGKHWKVSGLEDNPLSHQLAQAINSRKKVFLEQIRKNRQRIDYALQQIEYSPDLDQLDKDAWTAHQRKLVIKKFVGGLPPVNWVAEAIKGQQGSKEVADALNKRREELIAERIKEEKERTEKQRQQEVEKLRKKIRG